MRAHQQAGTTTADRWTNPVSGLWSDGADWSTGISPDGFDDVSISSTGSFTVTIAAAASARSLLLDGNNVTLADDASLHVAGGIVVDEATLLVAGGAALTARTITVNNEGGLQLGGTFATAATLVLDSANVYGTGRLVTEGQTIIPANADEYLYNLAVDGVSWTNYGTINDYTDIVFDTAAGTPQQIFNGKHGTLNLLTAGSEVSAGFSGGEGAGQATFINAGLLTAGSGLAFADLTSFIGLRTSNTGSIVVENGQTLIFGAALSNDGSMSIGYQSNLVLEAGGAIGGVITGPGTLTLETGTYLAPATFGFNTCTVGDIFGHGDPSPATLILSGTVITPANFVVQNSGTLRLAAGADVSITGSVQLGSAFDWPFGTLNDAGTITGDGTLTTSALSFGSGENTAGGVLGGGLTWQNAGTVNLDSQLVLENGISESVRIINEAGATFIDNGGSIFPDPAGGGSVLTNDGTLSSILSLNSEYGDYIDCKVVNSGLIVVAGTGSSAVTTDGSFVFGNSFTSESNAVIQIETGGALGLNAGALIQGSVTGTAGGVYLGYGQYDIETSSFDVGTLSAQGNTLDLATIDLEGSSQAEGTFLNASGATFTLAGKSDIVADGKVTMENDGSLVRSGGLGSLINGNLANNGTVTVQSGSLIIKSLTGTGQDIIGGAGTLDILHTMGVGQSTQFGAGGGTLILAEPESIASLTNFSAGDHLDLQGIDATGASISGTLLTVASVRGVFTFGSAGLLGNSVSLTTNAHGDALITIVASG